MALKHHVAFTVPRKDVSGRQLVDHFLRLGYKLVEENEGEWRFHRGSKLAAFWRFDIRAYSTDQLVRLWPRLSRGAETGEGRRTGRLRRSWRCWRPLLNSPYAVAGGARRKAQLVVADDSVVGFGASRCWVNRTPLSPYTARTR
jgi:hypothetical protein